MTKPPSERRIRTAGNQIINVLGTTEIKVRIGNIHVTTTALVLKEMPKPVILGTKFLQEIGAVLDFADNTFRISEKQMSIPFQYTIQKGNFVTLIEEVKPTRKKMVLKQDIIIPPQGTSTVLLNCNISKTETTKGNVKIKEEFLFKKLLVAASKIHWNRNQP